MAILVIDRVGRKVLLLASGASMCITIFALGTYFYLDEQDKSVDSLSWLPLVSLSVGSCRNKDMSIKNDLSLSHSLQWFLKLMLSFSRVS